MSQTQGIRVGRILGIPIYLDFSWILIFALVTLSLALQFTREHALSGVQRSSGAWGRDQPAVFCVGGVSRTGP